MMRCWKPWVIGVFWLWHPGVSRSYFAHYAHILHITFPYFADYVPVFCKLCSHISLIMPSYFAYYARYLCQLCSYFAQYYYAPIIFISGSHIFHIMVPYFAHYVPIFCSLCPIFMLIMLYVGPCESNQGRIFQFRREPDLL